MLQCVMSYNIGLSHVVAIVRMTIYIRRHSMIYSLQLNNNPSFNIMEAISQIILNQYCAKKRMQRKVTGKISKVSKRQTMSYCSQLYTAGIYTNSHTKVATKPSTQAPTKPTERKPKEMTDELCVICLCGTDSDATEQSEITTCNHQFHSSCLKKWKSVSGVCPVCRDPIV